MNAGLDLSTDFRGRSAFNLKLAHNRHWLTPSGTEWRNRVQIGEVPQIGSEIYHPLAWSASRADDWFVSAGVGLERRRLARYSADGGDEVATFLRNVAVVGLDIGQPWGDVGELRLGWSRLVLRAEPQLVSARLASGGAGSGFGARKASWTEDALRAQLVIDQLDFAIFPQSGYRGSLALWAGQRQGDLTGGFYRAETEASGVHSLGANTFEAFARVQTADPQQAISLPRYSLGGFHQLSGYQAGQLTGNHVLLLRLGWYRRLSDAPALTRGFFVGATLEAGNAWTQCSDVTLARLRTGGSVFLGADTGIGPLYLGLTYAPQGRAGLVLFIGRP